MKIIIFALIPLIFSIGIIPLLPSIYAEETKTIFIDSHLVDCVGVGPQKCMLVRDNQYSKWGNFYDNIEGFTFVEGYTYKLSVKITNIENPPADASSLKYELLEIISKNLNIDAEEPSIPSLQLDAGPSDTSIQKIPEWVKNIFLWYGQDQVSEEELLNAIKYLIDEGILNVN